MKKPENISEVKELLYKQLALLAEQSKRLECEPDNLCKLTNAMISVCAILKEMSNFV